MGWYCYLGNDFFLVYCIFKKKIVSLGLRDKRWLNATSSTKNYNNYTTLPNKYTNH